MPRKAHRMTPQPCIGIQPQAHPMSQHAPRLAHPLPYIQTMLRTMTHIVASAALTLALPLSAALPVVAWAAPQDRRAADQAYQGPYTVVREHHRLHVHANGSSEHELTFELRVDTEEGVRLCGQREVDFNQALEEVKVLEAYTVLPDGRRVDVTPDKIRLQDDRSDEARCCASHSALCTQSGSTT
ncbi:MAG: DUF3857 domain-containing protein [Betaproteobacteria bacterium]|nr:DUF3857 domain-containing protein [Betaproteobacteria bacterium]